MIGLSDTHRLFFFLLFVFFKPADLVLQWLNLLLLPVDLLKPQIIIFLLLKNTAVRTGKTFQPFLLIFSIPAKLFCPV